MVSSDGGVFTFGEASFAGSRVGADAPCVDLAAASQGYWVLAADGSIAAFGEAADHGDLPRSGLTSDAVRIAPTLDGLGYWVLDRAGGVFSFGDAAFFGSVPALGLAAPATAVAMQVTSSGRGYWIVDASGGVFAFGDAPYFGSAPELGTPLRSAAVDLVPWQTTGYWLVLEDGTTISFGRAPDLPDASKRSARVVAACPAGTSLAGLVLFDVDGFVRPAGRAPFLGSLAAMVPAAPIVGASPFIA
jgi:hypothetical protein